MNEILESLVDNKAFTIIALTSVLVATSSIILRYLNSTKQQYSDLLEKLKNQREESSESKKRKSIENLIKTSVTDEEKQKYLIDIFRKEINSTVSELDKKLKEEYENKNDPENFRLSQLTENFNQVRKRLLNELSSLSRRANLNLTIGIISSTIAIAFLFYSGIYSSANYEGKWFNFITYFIPKLSLLLFLGTFSFYFLNLYKSNLGVIQNYQSDLNDVDFKIIAITTTLLSGHTDKEIHLNELVKNVSNSQWNKILKNGESTVELQKLKENNYFDKDIVFKLWTMSQLFSKDSEKKNE
ncbi:hypothetical protein [Winogradskyella damuponensis]|uniref:Uncharacterized protein n=1 Tax=Winogradskyella damuponensis TaxID=943939 RepID=A0ABP8CIY0_9FLAO